MTTIPTRTSSTPETTTTTTPATPPTITLTDDSTTTTLHDTESQSQSNTLTSESPVDRLAILNEIGLSDRSFDVRPSTCLDSTPKRPRTISRLARSISVRVQSTQPHHHREVTRRFSDPTVDRPPSRILEPEDLPPIDVVPEIEGPAKKRLERWNSQKGKKWENIRARKREEEIKRRLEERKWEQRLKFMKGVLGKFMCRGEANDQLGELREKGRRPIRF